jgi:hypothetical protein
MPTPSWYEPKIPVRTQRRNERREEVKRLRAMGYSRDEIAEKLGVVESTVGNDIQALGLAGQRGPQAGRTHFNPIKAISHLITQADDLGGTMSLALDQLQDHDYEIEPDVLEAWDATLSHRDNITAVISRLRNYIKEQQQ